MSLANLDGHIYEIVADLGRVKHKDFTDMVFQLELTFAKLQIHSKKPILAQRPPARQYHSEDEVIVLWT